MFNNFNKSKKKTGFTLIELLVVIAIIGLLSSIVLVSLGPARQKARDARRQSDIRQIGLAMNMCYDDAACGGGAERYPITNAGPTPPSLGNYMPTVPNDPTNAAPYQYLWTANASPYQYYCLYAKLEGEANAWTCSSNKGTLKKVSSGYTPSNADCCGPNVTN